MRVLLTRPVADSARTRAALESLGHRVLESPVIAIEATGRPWPSGVVDAVLATSGQAFAVLAEHDAPNPEARRLIPLWLVGSRTEAVARQHGFRGASVVAANAVSLAMEMGKRRALGRVLYVAGKDRKPDIETALSVTEQRVETLEVYEARPAVRLTEPIDAALRNGAIDAVLHFSRRSAALFVELSRRVDLDTSRLAHHCLSDDVAAPLREQAWSITVATAPTEHDLIATLVERER